MRHNVSNLKFLLDENVDARIGRALGARGLAVVSCPKGISDAAVLLGEQGFSLV